MHSEAELLWRGAIFDCGAVRAEHSAIPYAQAALFATQIHSRGRQSHSVGLASQRRDGFRVCRMEVGPNVTKLILNLFLAFISVPWGLLFIGFIERYFSYGSNTAL